MQQNQFLSLFQLKKCYYLFRRDVLQLKKMTENQKGNDLSASFNTVPLVKSWDDFYESYDGKFDEFNMLHITIYRKFKEDLEDLGYRLQDNNEDWHKPDEGEYKFDDSGNLVIIHSCPDREIFEVELKQFIDDLYLNKDWIKDTSLTVM